MTGLTSLKMGAEQPERRGMTVAEFDSAGRLQLFGPEEKLELIEGEVYRKVSPQESGHSTGIRAGEEELRKAFGEGYDVRVQMPLVFGSHSKPEPDLAVVVGSFRDYANKQPTTAVLVIEVADTTLTFDRTTKAALYAKAGIEDYWIVNLRDRVLEVHRLPAPMADQPLGHHYRSITRYTDADTVSPLAMPQAVVAAADLLP
jgi:Uma2 family endonuclease